MKIKQKKKELENLTSELTGNAEKTLLEDRENDDWNEMILPNSYDDEKQEEEISNNDRKTKYDDDSLSMFEPSISKRDAKNKLRDTGTNLYRDKIVYDTENSRLLWPEEKKLVDNKTNESFEYF